MAVQISLSESDRASDLISAAHVREVRSDVAYLRTALVNVVFLGRPDAGDGGWLLVDTGLFGSKGRILSAVADRFGARSRPAAIVQTHGHFDHVGALVQLSREWNVPVFAHPAEHPFLDGRTSYPAPDTRAGGGIMPKLAGLFPRSPIDVSSHLKALPEDGSLPGLPSWKWLHTPGHTPGHVSFWREADRTLIAGDAVITTGQESAYEVVVQTPEMHGPPRYFTPDWSAAWASVRLLASLEPELLVTGHGRAMAGPNMKLALHRLALEFKAVAVPRHRKLPLE